MQFQQERQIEIKEEIGIQYENLNLEILIIYPNQVYEKISSKS